MYDGNGEVCKVTYMLLVFKIMLANTLSSSCPCPKLLEVCAYVFLFYNYPSVNCHPVIIKGVSSLLCVIVISYTIHILLYDDSI